MTATVGGARQNLLVAVSNNDGGIARHVQLARSAVSFDPLVLPESLHLTAKVRELRRRLRRDRPNCVITHGVAAGLAMRLRGPGLHDIRHVEFWHADPFFLVPRRRSGFRLLAASGRRADTQVFVNKSLLRNYASRRSEVVILPNTVPLSPEQSRQPSSDRRAVFVGRLSPEKGFRDLISAWPRQSIRRGWSLDIFGSGDLGGAALPPGVTFHGPCSDPVAQIGQRELLVIPSWTETGPYVALEALSVGRPFVGTRVGDMPVIVESANCGFLAPPADPPALQRVLEAAQRTSQTDLAEAGARGRAWLGEARSFEQWQSCVRELYSPDLQP